MNDCYIIGHMALAPGELGDRIAAVRREVGLIQGECAARAAIERTALAKIETGARRVGTVELARLADPLDVRIECAMAERQMLAAPCVTAGVGLTLVQSRGL